jgi:serine/threonine-protein kinase
MSETSATAVPHPSQRPGGAESLIGQMIQGRYRIDSILGEGGMGTVYAAEHTLMRKKVALKVLHPDMSRQPDIVERFEREALAAGHIDHPNIAAATDFGQLEDGSFFLVLELVVGANLADLIADGPLGVPRAIHIARQIASALARAHSLGVVHRDLKPDNVMLVTRRADSDFVKVLDFGIAKVPVLEAGKGPDSQALSLPLSSAPAKPPRVLTKAGMIYGTPAYMSPEQAVGEPVDGRADLYALGVLLFEMITGKRPFRHDNVAQLLGLHVTGKVPAMAEVAPAVDVPPAVEAIVRRLLAKDPAGRFATAGELETALAQSTAVTLPAEPSPDTTKPSSVTGAPLVAVEAAEVSQAGLLPAEMGVAPKSRMKWAGVAGASLLLGAIGALVSLGGHGTDTSDTKPTPAASPSAAEPPVPSSVRSASPTLTETLTGGVDAAAPVPEDPLAPALASAEAALKKHEPAVVLRIVGPLEASHGSSAAVHRLLERAYAMKGDRAAALREADAWLKAEPAATADLGLQSDIGEIATHPDSSGPAVAFLASRMGAPGVDILYDLAYATGQSPIVSKRAAAALSQPDVRSHGGPAVEILLDLRAAGTCEARHALLPRVKSDGDRRALTILTSWQSSKKEACMHRDGELAAAMSAVKGRSGNLL